MFISVMHRVMQECMQTEYYSGGYASFFVSGLSVAYKVISVGVEKRWGTVKYDRSDTDEKTKFKVSGPRFYIGFRF